MNIMPTHIVACAGIVVNEKDEVLLVKTHRDGWVFPGGQVEEGENLIDALKREIMEETGALVEAGEVFCISSNTCKHPGYNGVKEVPTKVMFDFLCTYKGGKIRASEENSESLFVPKEKALEMIVSPPIVERYKAFLSYDGRPTYLAYVTKPVYELKLKRKV